MKRVLVFKLDDFVDVPAGGFNKRATILRVGDVIVQTGRKLTITSVTVNGDVRVQAED